MNTRPANVRSGELVLRQGQELVKGDTAAAVARVNELGDTGQLQSYRRLPAPKGQAYFLVETRPLGARVMQHGQPTRRVHPAVVWGAVAAVLGVVGVLLWAVMVLVQAIAAHMALLIGGGLAVVAVLGLAGHKCVTTITHRH